MPINSATRIQTILQQAIGQPGNLPVVDCWAKLLNIDEININKKSILVAERLGCLYRELELIAPQMRNKNFSEKLYKNAINQIEHALSTMLLSGSWNQVTQYLPKETFVALGFCTEILTDEESQVSQDELDEILANVQELRASTIDSNLPIRLRQLVEHHIVLIEKALAEYPICGAKALREAVYTGIGELIKDKEIVDDNKEASEVIKLANIWDKLGMVADTALKTDGVMQLGQKVFELLENINL